MRLCLLPSPRPSFYIRHILFTSSQLSRDTKQMLTDETGADEYLWIYKIHATSTLESPLDVRTPSGNVQQRLDLMRFTVWGVWSASLESEGSNLN